MSHYVEHWQHWPHTVVHQNIKRQSGEPDNCLKLLKCDQIIDDGEAKCQPKRLSPIGLSIFQTSKPAQVND